MPGVSGVTVVTNARVYYTPRAAAGASCARHSLRPLFWGECFTHNSGASRREIADAHLKLPNYLKIELDRALPLAWHPSPL
jgi:hypothetical protein